MLSKSEVTARTLDRSIAFVERKSAHEKAQRLAQRLGGKAG
ncbi:MAG: hypothetical protein ACRESZ_10755 [Methylococcales bacterium]